MGGKAKLSTEAFTSFEICRCSHILEVVHVDDIYDGRDDTCPVLQTRRKGTEERGKISQSNELHRYSSSCDFSRQTLRQSPDLINNEFNNKL